jgi:hypothetical protein
MFWKWPTCRPPEAIFGPLWKQTTWPFYWKDPLIGENETKMRKYPHEPPLSPQKGPHTHSFCELTYVPDLIINISYKKVQQQCGEVPSEYLRFNGFLRIICGWSKTFETTKNVTIYPSIDKLTLQGTTFCDTTMIHKPQKFCTEGFAKFL